MGTPAENPAETPKRESLMGPMVSLLIVHGIALMILCGMFTHVAWKFRGIFESFGVALPVLTVLIINVGAFTRAQPLVLPLVASALLAGDAWVYYSLMRSENRTGAHIWYGVILGLMIAAAALVAYALFLPFFALMTAIGNSAAGGGP